MDSLAAPRRKKAKRLRLPEPKNLQEALARATAKPPAPAGGVSVQIVELATGQSVFERNADSPQSIASITKLFSTGAALHFLGPDYRFRTTFWRRGAIRDGLLQGSLLVVGGGDPNISGRFYNDDFNAVFDQWTEGLRRAGVTGVAGDLILNASFFDDIGRHPEWPSGQEAKWYQAPISALSYNDNIVLVSIRPGARPGRPASVTIDPPTGILRADSSARTVGRRGRTRVAVARAAGSNAVKVSGTVPSRPVWWSTPIAIDDPPAFFGAALRNRLANVGIQIAGSTLEAGIKPDASWTLVAETESDLLPTVAVTNKRSQGFYAEQLFKTLAAVKLGKGTWANALLLERRFLSALGLDPARYDLHDGSGLSPANRAAAGDLVDFLRALDRQTYGNAWKSTLAVSGERQGTLRHRFKEPAARGRILAKTGSIRGVSTLAGYLTANSGKTYVFAILLNGPRVWDSVGHAFQDRVLRAVLRFG